MPAPAHHPSHAFKDVEFMNFQLFPARYRNGPLSMTDQIFFERGSGSTPGEFLTSQTLGEKVLWIAHCKI